MRVFELAKELGVSAKDLIDKLNEDGAEITNHMQVLDPDVEELARESYGAGDTTVSPEPETVPAPQKENRSEVVGDEIILDGVVTVKEFADLLGIPGAKIVGELIKMRKMLPLTAELPPEVAETLATHLGFKLLAVEEDEDVEVIDPLTLTPRPPVVTVMGHVDHGKTSLLDAIRATQVAEREAGGITQHIGASVVDLDSGRVVFLDTPGHEAFTQLRARGAEVTDIVILIIAADDSIMPQTIEAINHARAADVPIIVAINKIDKDNADVEKVKKDLTAHNLLPEEWGGQTQVQEISAKKREGIRELLEMVLVQSEIMDLRADFDCPASGVIIEARLDKGKGAVATALIKQGTLRVGDAIMTGLHHGKIRAILDWEGNSIRQGTPSTPVEILGLSGVPKSGDIFEVVEDDRAARDETQNRKQQLLEKSMAKTTKITFDDLFSKLQIGNIKELKVVVKADVHGSLEAIEGSLTKLGAGTIRINLIHSGIGTITDNDVMLASASDAVIIGFNVRPTGQTRKLATREKVEIRTYRVIYDLINDIKAALEGLLEPETEEVVTGSATIREIFQIPKVGAIGGSYVQSGKITRSSQARLIRDGVVIWEGTINTLRRFKDDAKEVVQGYECGIGLENYSDIKVEDVIECFEMQEV